MVSSSLTAEPSPCFYVTADAQHANDNSIGYISFNKDGNLVLTPKLYKDDNLQIVNNKELFNFTRFNTGHDVIYDLYNDLRQSNINITDKDTISRIKEVLGLTQD